MHSKYASLLKDQNVKRWYENVSRGSPITGDVYLRRLGYFCRSNSISPHQLVKLRRDRLHNLLLDTVTGMEKSECSGGYVALVVKAVKSWLAFNGVETRQRIRIRGAHQTPTLQDERVPSQAELRRIFLAGDEKARTVCVLMAHSGLRPQVLGNYLGTDGLIIKDLPELKIEGREVLINIVPTMVRVRASLSKKAHEYFSFLGREGSEYLKAYLEARLRDGDELTDDSAVVAPKTAAKRFIRTINISDAARGSIRGAGLPWRPYVLRSFFATQLMLAESKGLIIRDYRSFFMGHKGDIEGAYTLNKRKLPPAVVEQMRTCYAKAQKFLETFSSGQDGDELTKAFKRQLLLVAGLQPDEISDEHLELTDEGFQKLVRDRLHKEVRQESYRQRVVSMDEIDRHLMQGWEFVGLLPDGRAIVKQSQDSLAFGFDSLRSGPPAKPQT